MTLQNASYVLTANQPLAVDSWENYDFEIKNNQIKLTSQVWKLSKQHLYDEVRIYDGLGIMEVCVRGRIRMYNKSGCESKFFDSYSDLFDDVNTKYLLVSEDNKKMNHGIVLQKPIALMDLSTMKRCEFVGWQSVEMVEDGIIVAKRRDEEYLFCTFGSTFTRIPRTVVVKEYNKVGRYTYDVVLPDGRRDTYDFSPKVAAQKNAVSDVVNVYDSNAKMYSYKLFVYYNKRQSIERSLTHIRIPKALLGGCNLKDGDGVLFGAEGEKTLYLLVYKAAKGKMQIYETFTLSDSLTSLDRKFVTYRQKHLFKADELDDLVVYLNRRVRRMRKHPTNVLRFTKEMLKVDKGLPVQAPLKNMYLPLNVGSMTSGDLITLFDNTRQIISDGYYYTNSGKVILSLNPTLESDSVVYSDEKKSCTSHAFNTEIKVVVGDSFDVARSLIDKIGNFKNVAVLNMANRQRPGGRAQLGAITQEACLYRASDYCRSLGSVASKAYPLDRNFGGVYSPGVTVFRESMDKGYALLDNPWKVNIIAVPPMTRPVGADVNYVIGMKNKIRTILRIAIEHGQTNLVLGAFGCGGSHNIPDVIANFFKEVFAENEFCYAFERIYFAIYDEQETIGAFNECFKSGKLDVVEPRNEAEVANEIREKRKGLTEISIKFGSLNKGMVQEMLNLIDRKQSLKEYADMIKSDYASVLMAVGKIMKDVSRVDMSYLLADYDDEDKEIIASLVEYFTYDAEDGLCAEQYVDELIDESVDEEMAILAYLLYYGSAVDEQRNLKNNIG